MNALKKPFNQEKKEKRKNKALMVKPDKNLVAYCGLYCGDCFFFKGEIADLARDLRKKLREARFNQNYQEFVKFAKEFKDYPQCYKVLGAMVKMRCKRTCQNGGGPHLFAKSESAAKRKISLAVGNVKNLKLGKS
jgi:hypothetical protein